MRLPPTFMPGMPCSQPSMTPPVMFAVNGRDDRDDRDDHHETDDAADAPPPARYVALCVCDRETRLGSLLGGAGLLRVGHRAETVARRAARTLSARHSRAPRPVTTR